MKTFILLLSLLPFLSRAQTPDLLPGSATATALAAPKSTDPFISPGNKNLILRPFAGPESLPADSLPPAPGSSKKAFLRKLPIPLTLIALGFAGSGRNPLIGYNEEIHEEIQEHYSGFNTKMDNYTRHAPIAAVYALNLAGIKGKHDLFNLTAVYLLADFINTSATLKLKSLTGQLRPDRSSADAFPSGHTSGAFTGATILYLEYQDQSIWYGVGGYSIAAATGGLRMMKNKHWLSDVLAGAGVGILSTQVAYAVYPWIQKKVSQGMPWASGQQLRIMPGYTFNTPGISLLYTLK